MRILGLEFFEGTPTQAVDRALEHRGLVVAPSGTCFRRLQRDEIYRQAVTTADLALPDSGFMVLLWRLLRGQSVARISGLTYLREMLDRPDLRGDRCILWILPNEAAQERTLPWLQEHGFASAIEDCYIAPIYGAQAEDPILLQRIESRRPAHIVIALSGGVQEKLGFYLRENTGYRPSIHCIGAALGFITGYQVAIPRWADRLFLGWFLRLISNPRRFLPRAMNAFVLPFLIFKYGETLPPLKRRNAEKLKH